jgi:hypothetical protein
MRRIRAFTDEVLAVCSCGWDRSVGLLHIGLRNSEERCPGIYRERGTRRIMAARLCRDSSCLPVSKSTRSEPAHIDPVDYSLDIHVSCLGNIRSSFFPANSELKAHGAFGTG